MPARKYSEETVAECCRMREAGATVEAIALALGMSIGAVNYHCLRNGADTPLRRFGTPQGPRIVARGNHVVRRFTPDEDATILRMELEGATVSEIGRALGRSHNSIIGRQMTLARIEERSAA